MQHQISIYKAYTDISTVDVSIDEFEKMVEAGALEGGLTTGEYLDIFKPDMNSETEVISLAMSIEAQALDLYQRVSLKVKDPKLRNIINKIANEEKTHMASLGKLLDTLSKEVIK